MAVGTDGGAGDGGGRGAGGRRRVREHHGVRAGAELRVKDASLYSHVRNLQDLRARRATVRGRARRPHRRGGRGPGREGRHGRVRQRVPGVRAGAPRPLRGDPDPSWNPPPSPPSPRSPPAYARNVELHPRDLRAYRLDPAGSDRRGPPAAQRLPRLHHPRGQRRIQPLPRRADVLGTGPAPSTSCWSSGPRNRRVTRRRKRGPDVRKDVDFDGPRAWATGSVSRPVRSAPVPHDHWVPVHPTASCRCGPGTVRGTCRPGTGRSG